MDFIISAITDIGTTKSTNQDSFNVRVLSTPKGKWFSLCFVTVWEAFQKARLQVRHL